MDQRVADSQCLQCLLLDQMDLTDPAGDIEPVCRPLTGTRAVSSLSTAKRWIVATFHCLLMSEIISSAMAASNGSVPCAAEPLKAMETGSDLSGP